MASNNLEPTGGAGDALALNTSSSGNLSFEVVISPARALASPRASKLLQAPTPTSSPSSLDDIAAKLKTAEENRERLMDKKLGKIKEHEKRVMEIRKISAEMQEADAQRKLENSQRKLSVAEELRQQHLDNLKEKLKQHDNHIAEVRKNLASKGVANSDDLQLEVDNAAEQREMIVDAIKEKEKEKGPEKDGPNGEAAPNGNVKENLIP